MCNKNKVLLLVALALLAINCGGQKPPDKFNDEVPNHRIESSNLIRYQSNVQMWSHIKTGQKTCYGDVHIGQDGFNQYGTRSYIDNGDGSVEDLVTNINWQKGIKENVNWYEAKNYCENLTLNGEEWRIPDTHEIKSLLDYGRNDPAIDVAIFPNTPSKWFWGAKAVGFDDINAGLESSWIVNFYDGFVEYTSRSNLYCVRCVKKVD